MKKGLLFVGPFLHDPDFHLLYIKVILLVLVTVQSKMLS